MRQPLLCAAALFVLAGPSKFAAAAPLRQIASVQIPGAPMKAFGAIIVDPAIHRAFVADRDNKSIDVIDTESNAFLSRVEGFVGVGKTGSVSGPQGLVAVEDKRQVWATDGDSTIKVIDLATAKVTDTISTGGAKRTGELAYDPLDHIVLATNPDDAPQFVTLISSDAGHKLLAKIPMPDATEGIERSVYFAPSDRFYVPVPSLDKARSAGGVAEIDPRRGRLVALHPTPNCNPHSVQAVSKTRLLVGCNFGPATALGPKGQLISFDLSANRIVKTGPGLGGDGQTAMDLEAGQYYAAANKNPGGPVLRVVDLATFQSIQNVSTWNGSHSVALDSASHRVYLPAAAGAAPCGGCVMVYEPAASP